MGKDPIQVKVTGKTIEQNPLDKAIVQGELYGETIIFTLDRYVNGKDLAADGLGYEINGVNSDGQSAVSELVKGAAASPDEFTLTRGMSASNLRRLTGLWIYGLAYLGAQEMQPPEPSSSGGNSFGQQRKHGGGSYECDQRGRKRGGGACERA